MRTTDHKILIQKHQEALGSLADEKARLWWERYMKGVIPFRGVGIPKNRKLLGMWRKEHGIENWPLDRQLDLALAFFEEQAAEDKLAGILYIQDFLYDRIPWQVLLERYEGIYERKLIFDWCMSDWFCVRVIGPTIKKYGEQCAKVVSGWKDAPYLWHARSAVVPFVKSASEPGYYPYVHEACSVLIGREERFAKTAVGWVLREISKHDEGFVLAFVEKYLASFSRESLGNALKYLDESRKEEYLQGLSAALQRSRR